MNLSEIHSDEKEVSAKAVSNLTTCQVTAIQILEGSLLKTHLTKIPALLICVVGEAIFQDEKGREVVLGPGDYHEIEPMVKHSVKGISTCQLLLIK